MSGRAVEGQPTTCYTTRGYRYGGGSILQVWNAGIQNLTDFNPLDAVGAWTASTLPLNALLEFIQRAYAERGPDLWDDDSPLEFGPEILLSMLAQYREYGDATAHAVEEWMRRHGERLPGARRALHIIREPRPNPFVRVVGRAPDYAEHPDATAARRAMLERGADVWERLSPVFRAAGLVEGVGAAPGLSEVGRVLVDEAAGLLADAAELCLEWEPHERAPTPSGRARHVEYAVGLLLQDGDGWAMYDTGEYSSADPAVRAACVEALRSVPVDGDGRLSLYFAEREAEIAASTGAQPEAGDGE